MIAVDSSAVVAIFRKEPDEEILRTKLEQTREALISTATVLELQLVLGGKREIAIWPDVEEFFRFHRLTMVPFDERQLQLAREAAVRYGKGRHKAALNFGDCFAYALARSENIPLLCTGTDFAATDVKVA